MQMAYVNVISQLHIMFLMDALKNVKMAIYLFNKYRDVKYVVYI